MVKFGVLMSNRFGAISIAGFVSGGDDGQARGINVIASRALKIILVNSNI